MCAHIRCQKGTAISEGLTEFQQFKCYLFKQPVYLKHSFRNSLHHCIFEFNIEKSPKKNQQLRCNERPIRGNVTIN